MSAIFSYFHGIKLEKRPQGSKVRYPRKAGFLIILTITLGTKIVQKIITVVIKMSKLEVLLFEKPHKSIGKSQTFQIKI